MSYTDFFKSIENQVDILMEDFTYTKKDIGYGYRWTFNNKLRFDLIDYKKEDTIILRVSRGAWLVEHYPILHGLFDDVSKVIAKFHIHTIETLHQKHAIGLFKLIDDIPLDTFSSN